VTVCTKTILLPPNFLLYQNCQVVIREPFRDGRENTWTGTGFMRTFEDSTLEFIIDNIKTSMEYDIVIRYEPQVSGTSIIQVEPIQHCVAMP
jgi:hypothetical protein